ncbi:MAG: hypothetical protein WAS24_05610 [Thermoplasmata archaeon]
MDPSEETRHTAREKLVESSVLEEKDRLWSPGNPLEWAARGYMSTGPDYHQDIVEGRTPEWKRRYWAMNALLVVIIVAFFWLLYMFFICGPSLGLIPAMALFLTGAAFLGVAALWVGRSVVNLEYGLPMPVKEALHQEKEEESRSPPRKSP